MVFMLPFTSVAVHVTFVVPNGNAAGALFVTLATVQLSAVTGIPNITPVAVHPLFVHTVTVAGAVMVGLVTSGVVAIVTEAVAVKWGDFVTAVINFIIVAFIMFLVIKAINSMKKKQEEAPAGPSSTDALLMEIRDAVKK